MHKEDVVIHEFFVVTLTSVYHVKDNDADGLPSVEKIALSGESALSLGSKLLKAKIVGIWVFLITYTPEVYIGSKTSPIVGLFKKKEEALECLKQDNREPCDARWEKQTREVIEAMGDNHPVFYICRIPGYCLKILSN